MSELPNIVLVHGAWADGSSWSAVVERLQADGYSVTAPQFPETSLADDVARLRQVLKRQSAPTIVAGHSYGGQIMTALGVAYPMGNRVIAERSKQFASFDIPEIAEVGIELDRKLAALLDALEVPVPSELEQ